MKKALITGVSGQDGSYLAELRISSTGVSGIIGMVGRNPAPQVAALASERVTVTGPGRAPLFGLDAASLALHGARRVAQCEIRGGCQQPGQCIEELRILRFEFNEPAECSVLRGQIVGLLGDRHRIVGRLPRQLTELRIVGRQGNCGIGKFK